MPVTPEENEKYGAVVRTKAHEIGCFDFRPDDIVWHYTDGPGFLGILQSSSLHATQVASLNDRNETKYATGLFKTAIEQLIEEKNDDMTERTFLRKVLELAQGDLATPTHGTSKFFVTCFSGEEDDLTQWDEWVYKLAPLAKDAKWKAENEFRIVHELKGVGVQSSTVHPPLSDEEVKQIVKSVCKYPAEKKRAKSLRRQEDCPLYWFKFNTRDWFSDQAVGMMTDFQKGWYLTLLCYAWQNGGFIRTDQKHLWRLAGAQSRETFDNNCDLVLGEFESVELDGASMLKHPKLATEFAEALQKWIGKKAAGEASKMHRTVTAARADGVQVVQTDRSAVANTIN